MFNFKAHVIGQASSLEIQERVDVAVLIPALKGSRLETQAGFLCCSLENFFRKSRS